MAVLPWIWKLGDVQFYNADDVLFYSFSILFERVYYLIK